MKSFAVFERAAKFFHLDSWFRLLMLCVVVGVVAGSGAIIFDYSLRLIERVILESWLFKDAPRWMVLIIPALGGALCGALALWLEPEATGHGTDMVIRAFHRRKGEIRARVPLVKGLCSTLTIGSGGSAGKEGPIAQIGAGFGSTLASWLKLSVRDRRVLMLAGAAGGIGAIFKAPLGGALFAAEVLYREPDFEHDAVIPGIISSVTAYSFFVAIERYFSGLDGHLRILQFTDPATGHDLPLISFPSPGGSVAGELAHYALLSLLCAFVAFLFCKGLKFCAGIFERIPVPKVAKPAIGGLALGALALLLTTFLTGVESAPGHVIGASRPEHIMGGGHSYLQNVVSAALDTSAMDAWVALKLAGFLCIVIIAKIIATGFTIGSGGSGGVLFPALFLGGLTGAAYAKFWRALAIGGWIPQSLALPPNARAGMILVGMGGVFAACTKTPIASLVMVSEITGSYGLLVPLMMTCASAYVLSRSFAINGEQVPGIADSPAHRGDFLVNVLEDIKVRDLLDKLPAPEQFRADTPFAKILRRVKTSNASIFPIVDEGGYLVGIFSLSDIRRIMNEQSVGNLIVAGDLGTTNVATVTPETNLDEALRLLTQKNIHQLPVVEKPDRTSARHTQISKAIRAPRGPVGNVRVIGMLSRRDLIAAYHRKLHSMQAADEQELEGSNVIVDALEVVPEQPPERVEPPVLRKPEPDPVLKQGMELLVEPVDDHASEKAN